MNGEERKPRKVPIRAWTCPNHPDGPPTIADEPAWEYVDESVVETILLATGPGNDRANEAAVTLGLCCRGKTWRTTGYRDAKPFEELMIVYTEAQIANLRDSLSGSILLDEMRRPRDPDAKAIVPLHRPPKASQ